jgi:hypothetical protein
VYTSADYAVYNLLGGVGTSSSKNIELIIPSRMEKLLQGSLFFIAATVEELLNLIIR